MSTAKRLGTSFESALVEVAKSAGFVHAERRAGSGAKDKGDLLLSPALVVEAKNHKALDVAGALDEAQVEKANAGADLGVAVLKRRGKNANEAYFVLRAEDGFKLLKEAGY